MEEILKRLKDRNYSCGTCQKSMKPKRDVFFIFCNSCRKMVRKEHFCKDYVEIKNANK